MGGPPNFLWHEGVEWRTSFGRTEGMTVKAIFEPLSGRNPNASTLKDCFSPRFSGLWGFRTRLNECGWLRGRRQHGSNP